MSRALVHLEVKCRREGKVQLSSSISNITKSRPKCFRLFHMYAQKNVCLSEGISQDITKLAVRDT
jgi:hypothetical protein